MIFEGVRDDFPESFIKRFESKYTDSILIKKFFGGGPASGNGNPRGNGEGYGAELTGGGDKNGFGIGSGMQMGLDINGVGDKSGNGCCRGVVSGWREQKNIEIKN